MKRLAVLLLLSGCDQQQPTACFVEPIEGVGNKGMADATAAQWAENVSTCVDHWAATLATSPDSPYAIADAAVQACALPISFNGTSLTREEPGLYPDSDAETKVIQADQRKEAVLRVEQFRAAHCKATT